MTYTEILEWVMGLPWPVIILFVLLIAGGIMRLLSENAGRNATIMYHEVGGLTVANSAAERC